MPTFASGVPADWKTYEEENDFVTLIGPIWENTPGDGTQYACAIRVEKKLCNRIGIMHGGALAAFSDQSLARAAWLLNDGNPVVTIQLSTSFIDAGRQGDLILCRTELMRRTKSLLFVRGDFFSGDRIVASASGVWKSIRRDARA